MIMSRNEIIQNDTINNEMTHIYKSVEKVSQANDRINRSLFIIFNLVRILTLLLRV